MDLGLAIFCLLIVLYATLAVKLGRWSITMPMVFVAAGYVIGPSVTNILPISIETESVRQLSELTLALLLFADASTLDYRKVQEDAGMPARLLLIGLPLTILAGALVALGLVPGEGLAFAALIGAILAPTDAALGLPIFNNPKVPVRIRRALNVESGLNDGIATPFVTLFLAFAVASETHTEGSWLTSALLEILVAIAAGVAIGVIGGWLVTQTTRRGWTSGGAQQMAILGLAFAAFFGSKALHGNGFIAAFVAGIAFAGMTRHEHAEPTEFTETLGTFLSLLVWGIFGAILLGDALRFTTDWRPILYAVLSLTLIRMIPVALSMRGCGMRSDTVTLMGWFGPRGLASVVFTMMALQSFTEANRQADTLVAICVWTIFLSVMAHGLSAGPLAEWYARRLQSATGELAEQREMSEMRKRRGQLVLAGGQAEETAGPGQH